MTMENLWVALGWGLAFLVMVCAAAIVDGLVVDLHRHSPQAPSIPVRSTIWTGVQYDVGFQDSWCEAVIVELPFDLHDKRNPLIAALHPDGTWYLDEDNARIILESHREDRSGLAEQCVARSLLFPDPKNPPRMSSRRIGRCSLDGAEKQMVKQMVELQSVADHDSIFQTCWGHK